MSSVSSRISEAGGREWTLVTASLFVVFGLSVAEVVLQRVAPVSLAAGNLLDVAVLANLARIASVLVILFGIGPFRLRDAGVKGERLLPGFGIVIGIWVLTQIGLASSELISDGMLRLYGGWRTNPLLPIAAYLKELGGEALFEEIFWRGFLLVWLTAELSKRFHHPIPGAFFGMMISQALFALAHIPSRLDAGIPWGQIPLDMVLLTLTGVYYGFLYLRTDNLFVPIGVHAMANWPAPLFDSTTNAAKITILVASAFLFVPLRPATEPGVDLATEDQDDSQLPPNPSPS